MESERTPSRALAKPGSLELVGWSLSLCHRDRNSQPFHPEAQIWLDVPSKISVNIVSLRSSFIAVHSLYWSFSFIAHMHSSTLDQTDVNITLVSRRSISVTIPSILNYCSQLMPSQTHRSIIISPTTIQAIAIKMMIQNNRSWGRNRSVPLRYYRDF